MNKWIAEFELEDGDTMPEHMDLEYKGAKIDFHCKPLNQKPIFDRDCEHCSKTYGTLGCCDTVSNEWVYSCKEGHREYLLNEIIAEIEKLQTYKRFIGEKTVYVELSDVLAIIDRYKAESEEKGMTNEEILQTFSDINHAYNNSTKYDTFNRRS